MDEKVFKDTPIIPGVMRASDIPGVPPMISKMRQMYEYGGGDPLLQAKNFYRQGKFMENFEDNATVSVHFQHEVLGIIEFDDILEEYAKLKENL